MEFAQSRDLDDSIEHIVWIAAGEDMARDRFETKPLLIPRQVCFTQNDQSGMQFNF